MALTSGRMFALLVGALASVFMSASFYYGETRGVATLPVHIGFAAGIIGIFFGLYLSVFLRGNPHGGDLIVVLVGAAVVNFAIYSALAYAIVAAIRRSRQGQQ